METTNNTDRPELIHVVGAPTPAPEALTEVKVSSTYAELPHTGAETWGLAGVGMALVLAGSALVRRFGRA